MNSQEFLNEVNGKESEAQDLKVYINSSEADFEEIDKALEDILVPLSFRLVAAGYNAITKGRDIHYERKQYKRLESDE